MKLTPPDNPNYAAQVVRIRRTVDLPGLDNLVGVPVLGCQALSQRAGVEVDTLMIAFTAETQLSEPYAHHNNLHRHEHLNHDPAITGYLEDNRRVKAIKLRGHRSDALLMPLSSVAFAGVDPDELREGDTFDTLNGVEICRKYVIRHQRKGDRGPSQGRRRWEPRVDERTFPKHFDTSQYFRNLDKIFDDDTVIITQKLHGTSLRVGYVEVQRSLRWHERLLKRLGVRIQGREYAHIYGSRNVVKDPGHDGGPELYADDLYAQVGGQLFGSLPKNWVVYGEVVGWTPPGAGGESIPIQKDYTYRYPVGSCKLFVYRVAVVGQDGHSVDLPWQAVKEFCADIGVQYVPELVVARALAPEYVSDLLDQRLCERFDTALPTESGQVDEGVCLRVERGVGRPLILKAKSPEFLRRETKLLDKGVQDVEEEN